MERKLIHGPLGRNVAHVCVDMQRLFAEATPWETPWMVRVLPQVVDLVAACPTRTFFTRFMPPHRPQERDGAWRRYWERWSKVTLDALPEGMADLVPELARFTPPAQVLDKTVYSPWIETDLQERLRRWEIDTLVVSGGETEVCVLATVLGGIDRGYRMILVADAVCSSSDKTHDNLLEVYTDRFTQNLEVVESAQIMPALRQLQTEPAAS